MNKTTVGNLCKPCLGSLKLDVDTLIDYFDIASVDNIEKKITGYTTYTFAEAPSRARKQVKKGNILVSTVRPNLNAVALFDKETENTPVASTGFCVLECKEDTSTRFLFRYLQSKSFIRAMVSQATGASYPAVSDKIVRDAQIPVHSYGEQIQIANVLDAAAKIISKRKQQLQKLDDLVKARFVELFGDVICNSKSWEMLAFADIASSRLGKMLDTKRQTGESSYPYLANFNVQWFKFNIKNLNQMDFNIEDRIEFELLDGDLLVCEGGEIGRCAVWHNEIQPCFFQKALHRVRCNRQIVHPDYLAWWFKYNCDHDGFAAIAGAKATIAHLPGVKLKQLRVAIPPLKLQEQFAAFVAQTDKSKVAIQEALDEAQLLFDSLMQKYFG